MALEFATLSATSLPIPQGLKFLGRGHFLIPISKHISSRTSSARLCRNDDAVYWGELSSFIDRLEKLSQTDRIGAKFYDTLAQGIIDKAADYSKYWINLFTE